MANLLVTGGAGFIGCHFIKYWLIHHPDDNVINLDLLTYAGNLANLSEVEGLPNYRFVKGDINDAALVKSLLIEENITTIVHFAAESHVDRSIAGPDVFITTNMVGTHVLLKTAKSVWLDQLKRVDCHFHHVSTDEVYGTLTLNERAFTENHPYQPNSPYAASKAGSDHLVRAYYQTYGLPITMSNCSNNYGPQQFKEKLIPLLVTRALNGEPMPIYGDGLQIRDWLFVEDHCRGIDFILNRGQLGEVYNIGGNNEVTNVEIARKVSGLIDVMFKQDSTLKERFPNAPMSHGQPTVSLVEHVSDRPGHDRRYAINSSKIHKDLGFTPQESFLSGLEKTVRWYVNNATMLSLEPAAIEEA